MAVELPDEVIVEILSMLPAKSLLRCRLVCKSWLSLINSTKFKLMHLHNFNQLNPRLDYDGEEEWFRVHFDNEAFTLDGGTHVKFSLSISHLNLGCRIIGCCNGVVCLCNDEGEVFSSDLVILWNPSIRRNLLLPLPIFRSIKSFPVFGFGYDKMSDDFKVVRVVDYNSTRPRAEVYTVKTGIWREVMFPDDLCCININYNRPQIFSNGSVHWIASHSNWSHNFIMAFDITTELFGEILLPDDLLKVGRSTILISVVGESLAVTYYNNQTRMTSSTYKIWVMKEYNNPTSWTLIFNMHFPDIDMGIPWQVRNKGDMIMETRDGNMIVYNYSGHASCICMGYKSEMDFMTYVDKWQESLALLDVGYSDSDEEALKALMKLVTGNSIANLQGPRSLPGKRQGTKPRYKTLTRCCSVSTIVISKGLSLLSVQLKKFEIETEMAVQLVLPDELIIEILSILPAKSLLRCRLVCKSWLSFINSTKFKLMHLQSFNQLNPRYFVRRLFHNLGLNSKECYDLSLWIEVPKLSFPSIVSVSAASGVVCLYNRLYDGFTVDAIILWNPSIRRKLTLPFPTLYSINSIAVLGFGYDKMSDDYKLVFLAYHRFNRPSVQVYALKTGNWREVLFPDNLLCYSTFPNWSQVFFNGFVHWIASDRTRGHNSIITFDTSTELFGDFWLPDDLVKVDPSTIMISVVGESLAVTYDDPWMASSTYKTWVMKEYKNPTSWAMIYNMHHPDVDMGQPLQIRNKGDMIMESRDGNMIVYNYSGYASCICPGYESGSCCRSRTTYVEKYQESLALLDVGHSETDEAFDDDRIVKGSSDIGEKEKHSLLSTLDLINVGSQDNGHHSLANRLNITCCYLLARYPRPHWVQTNPRQFLGRSPTAKACSPGLEPPYLQNASPKARTRCLSPLVEPSAATGRHCRPPPLPLPLEQPLPPPLQPPSITEHRNPSPPTQPPLITNHNHSSPPLPTQPPLVTSTGSSITTTSSTPLQPYYTTTSHISTSSSIIIATYYKVAYQSTTSLSTIS
ncbi:hypothetical protein OSB04_013206 [Centaurea solstitialis]|uniref:F-box domain-containing protein n=1 Tax=Centaurea solstitialis TaxID=347529 RepID=A0AA38WER7_9ASTR|nr:hypothetical protein OSB04_013206 [Centaurea solstitialis]